MGADFAGTSGVGEVSAEEGQLPRLGLHHGFGLTVTNADDNIQNHRGIGFTAELDAPLYLRRARILERVLGMPPP